MTVADTKSIETLPCDVFRSGTRDSLADGIQLKVNLKSNNNTDLLGRIADRLKRCALIGELR